MDQNLTVSYEEKKENSNRKKMRRFLRNLRRQVLFTH